MIESHVPASPVSTYRLQLNSGLSFQAAASLVPYFSALGITHLYLSPIWQAYPGSTHGYDICDPSQLSSELGGESEFQHLAEVAAAQGIGLILDFVSNHMRADPLRNAAWRDLLRNGPSSPYADYFDVDWQPVKRELQNKVLLPILGRQYGEILEAGELQIVFECGEFALRYWEHNLPLNPRQCRMILRHRVDRLKAELGETDERLQEYQSILFQLDHLPPYTEVTLEAQEDRLREINVATHRLVRLIENSEPVRRLLDEVIQEFNGRPDDPASFDLLHELLELQVYRLGYWRTALHEINYRRFFDINELAGIRMENRKVFDAVHAKAFELIRSGLAHGLRLDHIDGLYDPAGYLHELRAACGEAAPHLYVVVEKILTRKEPLSEDWPVDGTTGYEFLNQLNRLYVQPANYESIRRIYQRFTRRPTKFEDVVYKSKQQIITTSMASELNVLAHELNRMSEEDRRFRDFTLDSLQEALREIVACFPVYRTYISDRGASAADKRAIDEAVHRAIRKNPALESSIFYFVRACLFPDREAINDDEAYQRRLRFAMKFQQYTGPVQAKGIEDTAFYRYCPLASLNEVGGEPATVGTPVHEFHEANLYRQAHHPRSMIATSTHDTKRGEDARARINVLSEIPDEWRGRLRQWSRLASAARSRIGDRIGPDRNDEYLFYQTLLSIWPMRMERPDAALIERMQHYMAKAVKEAKIHSSWINPSNAYDAAVTRFVDGVLCGRQTERFLDAFVPFAHRVAHLGALNSISQLALKMMGPGVTDFYQGTELWDLFLVDPDNRRPVDFGMRREWLPACLAQMEEWRRQGGEYAFETLGDVWANGTIKGAITAVGLRFRRDHPELVLQGAYQPLEAEGPLASHVIAYARTHGDAFVLTAGLRWMASLVPEGHSLSRAAAAWESTTIRPPHPLQGRELVDLATNRRIDTADAIPISRLFRTLPAALLVPVDRQ